MKRRGRGGVKTSGRGGDWERGSWGHGDGGTRGRGEGVPYRRVAVSPCPRVVPLGALALVLTGCDRYFDVLVWWLARVLP
jgi:hypothetical protein